LLAAGEKPAGKRKTIAMIFGYSTNAFVKFSLLDAIDRIARLGFKGVEIMGDRPHLYPPDYPPPKLMELGDRIEQHRLTVTNLNSFTLFAVGDTYLPSWIEDDPQRRNIRIQHTIDSLKTAHRLGCRNISVPPGGPLDSGVSRKDGFKRFHEGLEKVIPSAEELGVKILIEPEPDLLMENTVEFLSFIKDVRSPIVGLNFDIGHFFCAGESPVAAFEQLFEWIGHVHIEDIAPSRVHEHLIAGHGAIRFEEIFDVMRRLGYDGHISLELYPYVDMPEEAGKESLAHLSPMLRESGLNIDL
jgi:sugar phosphate isomerase/epimerase